MKYSLIFIYLFYCSGINRTEKLSALHSVLNAFLVVLLINNVNQKGLIYSTYYMESTVTHS